MRSLVLLAFLAVSMTTVSAGLYGSGDYVIELTAANFEQKVVKGEGIWLVEFYAPWCGHCQQLTPEWKKAASALQGIVNVAAVDMDAHPSVGGPYGIKGFPTIKLFGLNKKTPTDYQGQRTAQAITDFTLKEVQSIVRQRLSGKGSSSSSSSGSKSSGSSSGGNGKVIELTDSNFEELVLNSDDLWLVEFFAPWCGHCKNLEPEWKRAASQLGGIAKLGAVDATVYQQLASKYGIRGYPTIKVFKSGQKDKPIDYESGRTADSIVQYTKNIAESNAKPKDVVELINEDILQKECVDSASICLVSFLPHILDSSAKQRNEYIQVLKDLAKKYKTRPFGYIWVEAGSQPKLEQMLDIGGTGYPAVAALNVKKLRSANLMGSFSVDSISDFLRNLLSGKEKTFPIQAKPTIEKITPWNGKDGVKPEEPKDDL